VFAESTYNLVDGLIAAGHEVHLANTTVIKKYDGLKHGSDQADAVHLAQVLCLGILPVGHICAPKERMAPGSFPQAPATESVPHPEDFLHRESPCATDRHYDDEQSDQAFLWTQKGEDQWRRGEQGAGAQVGARLLPHVARTTAFRRETLFCMKDWRSAVNQEWGLAKPIL